MTVVKAEDKLTLEELSARLNIVAGKVQLLEMNVPRNLSTRLFEVESEVKDLKMLSKVACVYACIGVFIWQSSKITRLQRELEEEVEESQ